MIRHHALVLEINGKDKAFNNEVAMQLHKIIFSKGGHSYIFTNKKIYQSNTLSEIIKVFSKQNIICIVFNVNIYSIEELKNVRKIVINIEKGKWYCRLFEMNMKNKFQKDVCSSSTELATSIYNILVKYGIVDEYDVYSNKIYTPYKFELLLTKFPLSLIFYLRKCPFLSSIEKIQFCINDISQYLHIGKYLYRQKIVFFVSMPKSGSNWLLHMLSLVPGYYIRSPYDPSRQSYYENITPLTFNLLPNYAYTVFKQHTRYTPYNLNTILNAVGKFLVLYRDPRDVSVSWYYHFLSQKGQRHYDIYHTSTKEEGLLHAINIVCLEYLTWITEWYEIAQKHHKNIYILSYEKLHNNVKDTMKNVLEFYEIPPTVNLLNKMAATQLKKEVDVKKSLKNGITKRKGIVGDWKNNFTNIHKDYFKKNAGELLIMLGYEKDLEW